jgi:hypothetical protein
MALSSSSIAKYEENLSRVLAIKDISPDLKILIKKFDARFKLHINQDITLEKKYFANINYSKNERKIYKLLLQNSSTWFCYEALLSICKKYEELENNVFLVKDTKPLEFVDRFRVNFIKEKDIEKNIQDKINTFYNSICDLFSNKNLLQPQKIVFLDSLMLVLENLKQQNIYNQTTSYNFAFDDFISELREIKNILCFNYKKKLEKKDFKLVCLSYRNVLGLCYLLRNHYVHNGLSIEIMNNSNLYVEFIQLFNNCMNDLIIYFSYKVFNIICVTENNKTALA